MDLTLHQVPDLSTHLTPTQSLNLIAGQLPKEKQHAVQLCHSLLKVIRTGTKVKHSMEAIVQCWKTLADVSFVRQSDEDHLLT